MKPKLFLASLLALCLLAPAALAEEYWTFSILKPGLRVTPIVTTRAEAVYFDHDSLPAFKDAKGKLVKPYGIGVSIKRDPSKDAAIDKELAKKLPEGSAMISLYRTPRKAGEQPEHIRTVWLYGVLFERAEVSGGPTDGTEVIYMTFVEADYVAGGKTYQKDVFGNFPRDHRKPQQQTPAVAARPAPLEQGEYWTFAMLKPGLRVNEIMSTRAEAVHFDHDSLTPFKDSKGHLVKPYAIGVGIKRNPSQDAVMDKELAKRLPEGSARLSLYRHPKKAGEQPEHIRTIWLFGVLYERAEVSGGPTDGSEVIYMTFAEADYVTDGKTYQKDVFGNFVRDHRKP